MLTVVPLDPEMWKLISYDGIRPNQIKKLDKSMEIQVDSSAAPVVYKLKKPQKVTRVKFNALLEGKLKYGNKKAGAKGADDFPLRVGLVVKGDKKLGTLKKWIAPDWVIELYNLAPKGEGIDKIYFLNVTAYQVAEFEERRHPLSDLFIEKIVGKFENSKVDIDYKLEKPLDVMALWISSDGDDIKSSFQVKINSLEIL